MSPSTFCKQNMPKLKYDKKYETKEAMDVVIATTQESRQPEKLDEKLSAFVKENVVKNVV